MINLRFDLSGNVETPTLVLATRKGTKLGVVPGYEINVAGTLQSGEINFKVSKSQNGVQYHLWDKLVDFRLLWCKEWDTWFELRVELSESNESIKNVTGLSLGKAELGQIMLYDIEINTESDISRDDYEPTVLYSENQNASLLHRIMEKAPHYRIGHVDASIASMQRTFQFDGVSIDDAYQDIAEELNCLFIIDDGSDNAGYPIRTVNVYDLYSYCTDCGHRGDYLDVCPECGSNNIVHGYGEDTTIYVSTENLAEGIEYTSDTDSVKNCFKLEAGDDLMTSTVINCNPNGSDYIWYISDEAKEDMSEELVAAIDGYNTTLQYYQNEHETYIDPIIASQYGDLVSKYIVYNENLEIVESPIVGFLALMNAIYNTIDFYQYLKNELMPDVKMSDTSASQQAATLVSTIANTPVAVTDLDILSSATASNAVLAMAKTIVDARYQVKIANGSLSGTTWTGSFLVTNYSDEEDTATSNSVSVSVTEDYETFVKQRIDIALSKVDADGLDIVSLFQKSLVDFQAEIKRYCLASLNIFNDSCQTCIDLLIEQGIANNETWAGEDRNLYLEIYVPYYEKLKAIQSEIKLREDEINLIVGTTDDAGNLESDGLQNILLLARSEIQRSLNFEDYLGEDLMLEFSAYRREDKYTNSNYISDGLNNRELFENAQRFIEVANDEIFKAGNVQHQISADLYNLLTMKEFEPLKKHFELGNWIRVRANDTIHRLRLLEFELSFDDIDKLPVVFSDVVKTKSGVNDVKSILAGAASMSTTYNSVSHQAEKGTQVNNTVTSWVDDGLALTAMKIVNNADNQNVVQDQHGMLFRYLNPITDEYDDEQLKIINNNIAITEDAWQSVSTAIGKVIYVDPATGQIKTGYGVNGEVIIGKLFLGESLAIYNGDLSFKMNDNGLAISNDSNDIVINPNSSELFVISTDDNKVFWLDENGVLHINGDGAGLDISSNSSIEDLQSNIKVTADGIQSSVDKLSKSVDANTKQIAVNTSSIEQNADNIALKVSSTDYNGNTIASLINQSATTVSISASKVNLSGYVTISSLGANGSTIVDGSRIQTGLIDADRVFAQDITVKNKFEVDNNYWYLVTNDTGLSLYSKEYSEFDPEDPENIYYPSELTIDNSHAILCSGTYGTTTIGSYFGSTYIQGHTSISAYDEPAIDGYETVLTIKGDAECIGNITAASFTGSLSGNASTSTTATNWSGITSGAKIDYGTATMKYYSASSSDISVSFNKTFTSPPTVVTNQVFDTANIVVKVEEVTKTGFIARMMQMSSEGSRQFSWIAIGV